VGEKEENRDRGREKKKEKGGWRDGGKEGRGREGERTMSQIFHTKISTPTIVLMILLKIFRYNDGKPRNG
jgi:hypothetical protein